MLYRVGNMPYTKPDSVDKCKTDIKTHMQIWTVLSNRSYTGFEPELLTSQVRLRTPWATEQTYRLWKPIDMKLYMCDANVQKHQFSNFQAY